MRKLFMGGWAMALAASIGVLLGWLATRGVRWREVADTLRGTDASLVAAGFAVVLLSGFLRAVRWRVLWVGVRVRLLRLFLVEHAALGLDNLVPIRAMDEAVQLGILTLRDRLPAGTVVATMMTCRVLDLIFTLSAITVALAAVPALVRFAPAALAVAAWLAAWVLVLYNAAAILRRFPVLQRLPVVSAFATAITDVRARARRLGVAFMLTALYWLVLTPVGWVAARGVGIDLAPHEWMITVLGAIFFATTLPSLPGALGSFEFAVVSLAALWGVPREAALSYAFLLHVFLFLPPTVMALVVLPREGLGSVRALRGLERRARNEQETERHARAPRA